ncbi:anti-sigma factor family protein [Alkaliphilus peptidifermentans]|uniref:Zinc-finger n=1 Tax=Alkaliphilus peptidifermentans DSM 18978 TaxID=1120976 RepID=A0A1G5IDD3_9FIRM|nr:zf-HC2 domain-containing protein [Alkaliphilus peptidifermentans]SCY74014.1 hypothetical protein SAMN03080606_02354 [Alkaliphilus peptidifermentans DSM 18978]
MDCKTSSDLIMSYMDKNIADKDLLDLQHHIAVCANCSEEFLLFEEMVEGVKDLPMIEPSAGFEMKVMDSIDYSLYKKTTTRLLGLKEVFICTIIYLTALFVINGAEYSFNINFSKIPKLIQQLSLLGTVIEELVGYSMIAFLYPRKMIFFLLSVFSRATTSTLMVYSLGLFVLTLVLVMIQTTLFKILKNQ